MAYLKYITHFLAQSVFLGEQQEKKEAKDAKDAKEAKEAFPTLFDAVSPVSKEYIKEVVKQNIPYLNSLNEILKGSSNKYKYMKSFRAYKGIINILNHYRTILKEKEFENLMGYVLLYSVGNGFLRTSHLLLRQRASLDFTNKEGYTPLFLATMKKDRPLLKLLLHYKANTELEYTVRHKKSQTALIFAASTRHNSKVTHLLLKNKANPNKKSIDEETALMGAAKEGCIKSLKVLLQYGANPSLKNKGGQTALLIATAYKRNHAKGGDLDKAYYGIVKKLLEYKNNPNTQDSFGTTPLMGACMHGDFKIVHLLLKKGAQPNITNALGETALVLAIKKGHKVIIKRLLKAGANMDILNNKNKTALSIARSIGNTEIMNILLNHRALQPK